MADQTNLPEMNFDAGSQADLPEMNFDALPEMSFDQPVDVLEPLPVSPPMLKAPVFQETQPEPVPEAPSIMSRVSSLNDTLKSAQSKVLGRIVDTGKDFLKSYAGKLSPSDAVNPFGAGMASIEAAKEAVIDPLILKPAQDYAYSAWNNAFRGGKVLSPEAEFTHRNLGKLVLGEQASKQMSPERENEAISAIGKRWQAVREKAKQKGGSLALGADDGAFSENNATAYAQAAMQGLSDLPIYLINPDFGASKLVGVEKALARTVEGGSAGLLSALATPGASVKEGTYAGAALGGALGSVEAALSKRPQIIGVVHPEHVQEFADKLAAKPQGKVEHVMAEVIDVAPDGSPVLTKVGNDLDGNVVSEQMPLEGWTRYGPEEPPLPSTKGGRSKDRMVTSTARAKLDKEKIQLYIDTEKQFMEGDAARIAAMVDGEKYVAGPGYQVSDKATGKVLVDADGAIAVKDASDPYVRKMAFAVRGLAEVKLPNGETALAHVVSGGGDHLLLDPIENHPRTIPEPGLYNMNDIVRLQKGTDHKNVFSDAEMNKIAQEAFDNTPTNLEPVTVDAAAPLPGGVGGGGKPPVEPPLPPAPPPNGLPPGGGPPPVIPDVVTPEMSVLANMKQYLGNKFAEVQKSLASSSQRGPKWIAQAAMALETVKRGGLNNEMHYLKAIERNFGIKDPARARAFQSAVSDAREGFKTEAQLMAEFPEYEIAQQKFFRKLNGILKENEKELARLGVITEAVDATDLGGHAWRGYNKDLLPKGVHAKVVRHDEALINKAKKHFIDSMGDPSIEPAAKERLAENIIDVIIGDPKYDDPNQLKSLLGSKAAGSLKARMDLRPGVDRLVEEFGNKPELREMLKDVIAARGEKTADVKPALEALLKRIEKSPNSVSMNFTKAVRKLAEQDELSYMVRQLLGETDLGYFRMARTLARQEALISALRVWEGIAAKGPSQGVFSAGPLLPDGTPVPKDWVRLSDMGDARDFGPAANGWMEPKAFEQLHTMTAHAQNAASFVHRLMRRVRFMRTVGAGYWGVLSNSLYTSVDMMKAGGVQPFMRTPKDTYNAFADTVKSWQAWRKNPISNDRAVRMYKRGQELGMFSSGFGRNHLKIEENAFANALLKELDSQGKLDFEDLVNVQLSRLERIENKTSDAAAYLYDAVDPIAKGASWHGLMQKGGYDWKTGTIDREKAAAFLGEQFNAMFSTKQLAELVETEAARRVGLSFPMHDRLPPLTQKASGAQGILVDSFFSSMAEDARTWAALPGRIKNEPGMFANVLHWGLAAGAFAAAAKMSQRANGVNEDEVQEAFNRLPESAQAFRPFAFTVGSRDARGELKFFDPLSQAIFPLSLVQGNPELAWYMNLALSPLTKTTGDSMLGAGVRSGLAQLGWGMPEFNPRMKADQHNTAALIDRLMLEGYGPSAIQKTFQYLREGNVIGQQSKFSPQYDPETVIQRAISGGRVLAPLTRGQVRTLDDIKRREVFKSIDRIHSSSDSAGGPAQFMRDSVFGKESTQDKKHRLRQEAREKDSALRRKQGLR